MAFAPCSLDPWDGCHSHQKRLCFDSKISPNFSLNFFWINILCNMESPPVSYLLRLLRVQLMLIHVLHAQPSSNFTHVGMTSVDQRPNLLQLSFSDKREFSLVRHSDRHASGKMLKMPAKMLGSRNPTFQGCAQIPPNSTSTHRVTTGYIAKRCKRQATVQENCEILQLLEHFLLQIRHDRPLLAQASNEA